MTKRCGTCGKVKARNKFSRYAHAIDGLHNCCKECQRDYQKSRACTTTVEHKWCNKCKRFLPAKAFYKNLSMHDGLATPCRQCAKRHALATARTVQRTHKRCPACKETKPAKEFFSSPTRDGLSAYCKECDRWRDLERKHGMSKELYEATFQIQKGLCAICQLPSTLPLVVDHCHKSGKVRALLCKRCNSVIGLMHEKEEALRRAADYIAFYKAKNLSLPNEAKQTT